MIKKPVAKVFTASCSLFVVSYNGSWRGVPGLVILSRSLG